MPLPKRRHTSTRQAKRRTHYKLTAPTLTTCPRCKAAAQAHHICPECGYYNGRQWLTPKSTAGAE
jgi:large subunit ribosomal protein L32